MGTLYTNVVKELLSLVEPTKEMAQRMLDLMPHQNVQTIETLIKHYFKCDVACHHIARNWEELASP